MARVLLVEDDFHVAEVTVDLLGEQGHLVRHVDEVAAALDAIAQGWPELVLTDFLLGSDTCRPVAAAAEAAGIGVLVVTGALDGQTASLPWPVLAKPFRADALAAAMAAVQAGGPTGLDSLGKARSADPAGQPVEPEA